MKRIALYIRVSTEEQARIQDGSLVSQRKRLEEYVDGQNRRDPDWGQVVDIYVDEGRSAKDMKRPQFQRLLSDVRAGRINLILSTELSRLSRSIRDFCEIWDLFKKHNANFITLREQFDTTSAAGEMMVFNLINFAQFERKQTAERISANWASRAKRGLWNGGSIPLGFDRNPKNASELLVNKAEAKTVQKIFELFLKTGSVRKTCLELSARGVFAKRFTNKHGLDKGGGHFTITALQRTLTNKAYIGLREIDKSKGKTEVVKATWPAILDLEIFNKVQERLQLNKNKYKPEEWKKYPFPLTELLVCGECGKHLGGKSGHGRNGKHFYYGHPRQLNRDGITHLKRCTLENIRAPRMEEIILQSLKKLIDDPALLKTWLEIHAAQTSSEMPGIEGRLKTVETDISTNHRRLENLTSRLADLPKEIPADAIYKQIQAINDKLKELENVKSKLAIEQSRVSAGTVDTTELLFRVKRVINSLEKAPVEDRRPIFANLIKFAEVYPTKIRLGVYAPAVPTAFSQISNFSAVSAKRGGSCTVSFGARRPRVEEPLGMALEYPFQWRGPRFDLAMLAKQRRVENRAP
jgi:DNA invertase Pin-like site-specific DNA recombinase